jgi:hypothetical protein
MDQRLLLQAYLELISPHVYFQPPPNIKLEYPCIVYSRDGSLARHAENVVYLHTKRYLVTVIDQNPDSDIPDKVESLPLCLNHYVFNLYF